MLAQLLFSVRTFFQIYLAYADRKIRRPIIRKLIDQWKDTVISIYIAYWTVNKPGFGHKSLSVLSIRNSLTLLRHPQIAQADSWICRAYRNRWWPSLLAFRIHSWQVLFVGMPDIFLTGIVCWYIRYLTDKPCLLAVPISSWQVLFSGMSDVVMTSLVYLQFIYFPDMYCLLACPTSSWQVLSALSSGIFLTMAILFVDMSDIFMTGLVCWHARCFPDNSCLLACPISFWHILFVGMSDIFLTYFVCWHVRDLLAGLVCCVHLPMIDILNIQKTLGLH